MSKHFQKQEDGWNLGFNFIVENVLKMIAGKAMEEDNILASFEYYYLTIQVHTSA